MCRESSREREEGPGSQISSLSERKEGRRQQFVDNRQKTTQFQATVFFAGLRVVSGSLCSRNIKQSLLISMVLLLDELIVARNAWGHLKMNMEFSAFGPNSSNFVGLST